MRRGFSHVLEHEALEELGDRIGNLPEPLAYMATWVEAARGDGDATGVVKAAFDLGVAVVRYGVGLGLGRLAQAHEGKSLTAGLSAELQRAARLSDGQWCALARAVGKEVLRVDSLLGRALAFAGGAGAGGTGGIEESVCAWDWAWRRCAGAVDTIIGGNGATAFV